MGDVVFCSKQGSQVNVNWRSVCCHLRLIDFESTNTLATLCVSHAYKHSVCTVIEERQGISVRQYIQLEAGWSKILYACEKCRDLLCSNGQQVTRWVVCVLLRKLACSLWEEAVACIEHSPSRTLLIKTLLFCCTVQSFNKWLRRNSEPPSVNSIVALICSRTQGSCM